MRAAARGSVLLLSLIVASCSEQATHGTPQRFTSPAEAVAAFNDALRNNDHAALRRVLGPEAEKLLHSGDAVSDGTERAAYLDAYAAEHDLVPNNQSSFTLRVGPGRWPLPFPIVMRDGYWQFDPVDGANEISLRRIGRNELAAVSVCRGFVEAQREYAAGSGGAFAKKLRSDPGTHNGLFWEVRAGEPESPAGPLLARAAIEGYAFTPAKAAPYHGYFYRPLLAQGPAAVGGAYDFAVADQLVRGFALVAFPAVYGASGIMTFIVNQDGVVYQKDLGEDTPATARAMREFNPDQSWVAVSR